MSHPYEDLPQDSFWRTAVSETSALQIKGLWKPKALVKKRDTVITAGSCFAQHISRALIARGYNWLNAEPAPQHMTDAAKRDYHYDTFSFRTGNIYTTKMLHQWVSWAVGASTPPEVSWEKDGRYYDPFRPGVEKDGFQSIEEMLASRAVTIAAVRRAIETADHFVFTMGLTEAWQDRESGVEYAVCPGTIAGIFDPDRDEFVNHGFQSCYKNLRAAIKLMNKLNSRLRYILTVSPVPLTATASGEHVLTATSLSKSVLRAAAGEMANASARVDYFPSYEMITHPAFRGVFYEPNQRTVDPKGVEFVMESLFRDQRETFAKTVKIKKPYGEEGEVTIGPEDPAPKRALPDASPEDEAEALLCEEEMLNAFSK